MSRERLEAEYAAAKRDYDAALAKLSAAKAALTSLLKAEEDESKRQRLVTELAVLRAYVDGAAVKDLLVLMERKGTSIGPVEALAERLFHRFIPRDRWWDEEFESRYDGDTVVRSFAEVHKNQARAVLAQVAAAQP